LHFPSTGKPDPGSVAVNVKQKFLRTVYPQLVARVLADGGYLATEEAWDAEAAAQEGTCGRYCLTDTHIILPCYKHYFASAQDDVAGKGVGDWAGDAIRNITGSLGRILSDGSATPPFTTTPVAGQQLIGSTVSYMRPTSMNVSLVVPTADENRPKTSYLLPCIKACDVAVNAAQVDLLALAAQVAAINGEKVDKGDVEYRSIVELKGSRSTTGTWTIVGVVVGKPLILCMDVSATLSAFYVINGAVAAGTSSQPFGFLTGSTNSSVNAALIIPTDTTVSIGVNSLYSGGTIYAYQ